MHLGGTQSQTACQHAGETQHNAASTYLSVIVAGDVSRPNLPPHLELFTSLLNQYIISVYKLSQACPAWKAMQYSVDKKHY